MIAGALLCAASTLAIAQEWKDGVLFTEEELTSLEGHKAFKIVFGLEPGKCAGEFTAPDEWLTMTSGTIVFKHLGELTWEIVETEILPRLASMEAGS